MPIVEPAKLRAALPPGGRLLGLDVGEKTIGLAVSDPGLAVASPLVTLRRGKFTAVSNQSGRHRPNVWRFVVHGRNQECQELRVFCT